MQNGGNFLSTVYKFFGEPSFNNRSALMTGYYPIHLGRQVGSHAVRNANNPALFMYSMESYGLKSLWDSTPTLRQCPPTSETWATRRMLLASKEAICTRLQQQRDKRWKCQGCWKKNIGFLCRWHLGFCHPSYLPTNRGFDTFYGYYNGAENYYNHTRIPTGKCWGKYASAQHIVHIFSYIIVLLWRWIQLAYLSMHSRRR